MLNINNSFLKGLAIMSTIGASVGAVSQEVSGHDIETTGVCPVQSDEQINWAHLMELSALIVLPTVAENMLIW